MSLAPCMNITSATKVASPLWSIAWVMSSKFVYILYSRSHGVHWPTWRWQKSCFRRLKVLRLLWIWKYFKGFSLAYDEDKVTRICLGEPYGYDSRTWDGSREIQTSSVRSGWDPPATFLTMPSEYQYDFLFLRYTCNHPKVSSLSLTVPTVDIKF